MRISEIYKALLENREQYVVQTFGSKLVAAAQQDQSYQGQKEPENVAQELKKVDPENGKNIVWIAKQYGNRQFIMQDIGRTRADIQLFLANRSRLIKKDLNTYVDMRELKIALEPFREPEDPAEQEFLKGKIDKTIDPNDPLSQLASLKDTKVLKQTPNFLVTIPQNLDSSRALCKLHGTTNWCTQNTDNYKDYSSQGPLYVIAVKQGNRIIKYQFHVPSKQYKDARDDDLTQYDINLLSSIPEYTEFLNYLIKKYYGKYFK